MDVERETSSRSFSKLCKEDETNNQMRFHFSIHMWILYKRNVKQCLQWVQQINLEQSTSGLKKKRLQSCRPKNIASKRAPPKTQKNPSLSLYEGAREITKVLH